MFGFFYLIDPTLSPTLSATGAAAAVVTQLTEAIKLISTAGDGL